ncbi:SigE family RNA polymerase sigma factor [soil metagenome]
MKTRVDDAQGVREGVRDRPEDDPFARLFFAHAGRLVRLAGFLGAADPEDVVQEAFCKVFAGRERLRSGDGDTVRYLTRAVVNEIRDRHRRAEVARGKAHLVAATQVFTPPDSGERLTVRQAVAALPPRQREAVVLRYWLDLPLDEVARVMGVRTGTAKSQVSRALDALRAWWGDPASEGEEPR